MIKQQQFYVLKLNSSRLKDSKYNIKNMSPEYAREHKELILLGDNQILKTLRKLTNKEYDFNQVEKLRKEKNALSYGGGTKNKDAIKKLQKKIDDILFIPEYVSIVIEKLQHYDRIFKKGFKINGKRYKRISCSASQARVNTVIFVEERYYNDLKNILNNGREDKPIVPNKYNAYFGLNSSSIYEVTRPKVCIVSDKEIEMVKKVDFITEIDDDDIVETCDKKLKFNLFDGQGICSVEIAKQWAKDLKLLNKNGEVDYIPSYFITRSNWIKGALFTFDIHSFAKEIAHKDKVVDIYGIERHIEDIDVFISQSQFKLYGSYNNWEEYTNKSLNNGLVWGVSRVCPKYLDEYTTTNYQFVQTTDMNDDEMKSFLQPTIDWIEKVLDEDPIYTTLFLNGSFKLDADILELINKSNNPYVKAIIYNNKMLKDNEVRNEVYRNIKKKIKELMISKVLIEGNFSMMCADPYAQCEHIFGMEVKGLLHEREYYSNFWNKKSIKEIDAMRSPLTFYSEHNILELKNNKDMDVWYRYQYGSTIYNVWGTDCIQHADSDWDGDIVCTTSNRYMINGVRREYLPITYDKKSADKVIINDNLLYSSDKDSFFSTIGSVTNVSTSFYAMLSMYDKDSKEYKEILRRLKILRKEQGNAIDKAKGIKVKSFNRNWIDFNQVNENDSEEIKVKKEFNNTILADKKPYFMYYLYKHCKSSYDKHINIYNTYSQIKFGCNIHELIKKTNKTDEEEQHIKDYYKYTPLLTSNCLTNRICWYVEKINEEKFRVKNTTMTYETIDLMIDKDIQRNNNTFKKVEKIYQEFKTKRRESIIQDTYVTYEENENNPADEIENMNESFRNKLLNACPNIRELANYAVELDYFPREVHKNKQSNITSNKDFTWKLCSDGILENIKKNSKGIITIPIQNPNGHINYLGKKFSVMEVQL